MNKRASAGAGPRPDADRDDKGDLVPQWIPEAGPQLWAPWAASIASLLFAVQFTRALVLLRGRERALIGAPP